MVKFILLDIIVMDNLVWVITIISKNLLWLNHYKIKTLKKLDVWVILHMQLQVILILFKIDNGEVYVFGYNGNGQFGNGNTNNSNIPILMKWKCIDIINNPLSLSCFVIF